MIIVIKNIPFLADALRAHNEVMSVVHSDITNEFLRQTQATAIFIRTTTKVNETLLRDTAVRFVGSATSGTDHLDIDYLEQHHIHYASALGSNSNAVAEYVLYCMLTSTVVLGKNFSDLCIGVVGFGHIGKRVAANAHLLGMRVLISDPPVEESGFVVDSRYERFSSLPYLLSHSDMVSNHIPLTFKGRHATKDLFNAETLALLKSRALFIHASRGGVVNEEALVDATAIKELDLCLDVWKSEPDFDLGLAQAARIATPHISGHSEDGILLAAERLLDQFAAFDGNSYDNSIINSHTSPSRKKLTDFHSIKSLEETLAAPLALTDTTRKLCALTNDVIDERKALFQNLRSSYLGRQEVLEP